MDFQSGFGFMPELQVLSIQRKRQISCILTLERYCLPLQPIRKLKKHGLLHELILYEGKTV